jgi:hypothetical protein
MNMIAFRSRPPIHGRQSSETGQVLVIVALGLVALVAMVGLVIDGGYAWGRQRVTQNGADSIAKAGSVVILRWLDGETLTLGDISCAVNKAAEDHNVEVESADLTDHEGNLIGVSVPEECIAGGHGPIPATAQGVKATTRQVFDTFLMGVVGIRELMARADATAVVGPVQGTGVALPVTFPQTLTVCDDQEVTYTVEDWGDIGGANTWEPYEILPDPEVNPEGAPDADNLAIIPLCTTGPGSVGWLEFGCGNLSETISNPCDTYFPIPTWIQTQTGTVDSLEDELEEYHGDEPGVYEAEGLDLDGDTDHRVQLPIHTTTCEDDAGVSDSDGDGINELNDCPEGAWTAGEGNNLWYGVPFWVGFVIDEAHVQGGDNECEDPEGTPQLVNPGGNVGCLKGWFVRRYAQPTDVGIGDVNPGDDTDIAVVLIN